VAVQLRAIRSFAGIAGRSGRKIVNTSPTTGAIADALAGAQGEIEGARKDSLNPHFRSKYADLASIWDACRSPLAKHKLSVVQTFEPSEKEEVRVVTRLLHASGEWLEGTICIPVTKADAQGVGSAATYARRYSLAAIVGIAPEDDDGNAASAAPPERRAARVEESLQRELGVVPVGPEVLFTDSGARADAPSPAPEPPGEAAERRPTKKQLGLLFARTREAGIEPGDMRQLMKALWGASSSEALTMSMFRQLVGDSKAGVPGILDDLREKRVTIPQLIAEVTP
jgi:hypothetical protein